tara:strand:+ start:3811 stop:4677 length:867 start_codon:yes stop_codon:yes gene_type:complete
MENKNLFLNLILTFILTFIGVIGVLVLVSLIKKIRLKKDTHIPKVLIQTYHSIEKIPQKVFKNIQKFNGGYTHIVFDDNMSRNFIEKEYGRKYREKFDSFKLGAHKADFFRYCYLYKKGGIYLDIKTSLQRKLDDIIFDEETCYTVLSKNKEQIYQGFIACSPGNVTIKRQLDFMMLSDTKPVSYQHYTKFFYKTLVLQKDEENGKNKKNKANEDKKGKLEPGLNQLKDGEKWYLFFEICHDDASECKDGLDRYGYCSFIYDNDDKNDKNDKNDLIRLMKTRYSDYPW